MYVDPSGNMPRWAKWLIGGLAVAGLIVATILTCGVACVAATAIGSAMLTGGLVSAVVNINIQLQSGEPFEWTQLAISTLSGTMYGLVVATTGGVGASIGTIIGKFAIAGGTSLLESWNQNSSLLDTFKSLALDLFVSGVFQGAGYIFKEYGPQILSKFMSQKTNGFLTIGDMLLELWNDPKVKTGVIKFVGGAVKSFFNNR